MKKCFSVTASPQPTESSSSCPSSQDSCELINVTVDGSYKCGRCSKVYKQKASLFKHLEKNHKIMIDSFLTCKVCNKSFENLKKTDDT